MRRMRLSLLLVVVWLAGTDFAIGQTTGSSLRGYVKDDQGAVLPGVTVVATSPTMIQSASAVTDETGYYRVINLPPGDYTVSAELQGFAPYKREGIVLRAAVNFQVDITLALGTVAETITVRGESPMLEVSKPGNILNIDGEFQKQMPLAARKNWTDFLEQTPGVHSRPFDDGSGRSVYFGHATEHFAHVVQLEGMQAGNYNDFQLTYVQMGSDMIQDTQVKTGGNDAATPMGTGLAINVITKSGGNSFRGTAGYAYQPLDWSSNNTGHKTVFDLGGTPLAAHSTCPDLECTSTGGTPVQSDIGQFDGSIGGPIKRDKVWFFASFRKSAVETQISRNSKNVSDIQGYFPGTEMFPQQIKGYQPYVKITSRVGSAHELSGFYQRDRTHGQSNWQYFYDPINVYSNGGNVYSAKLTSAWGDRFTTTFSAGYNDKSGNNNDTYTAFGFDGQGPNVNIYDGVRLSSGFLTGNSLILEGGNVMSQTFVPASLYLIRGDATYYKAGWGGSHEFATGFFLEPENVYDQQTVYSNGGFFREYQTVVDVNNPSLGVRPYRRDYADPISLQTRSARDRNYAFYLQDSWKPGARLTANIGMRFDYVKRVDQVKDITRQNSWTVQPRLGATYLLTQDARNVLRASYARMGEQVMGRDGVTTFGADDTVSFRREFDNNLNGVFGENLSEIQLAPATSAAVAGQQIAPDLHQPYIDEFIVGFRRQFRWQMGLDVGYINRAYKDTWARVDINGFYPDGPGQPFGGFGRVDPNQGIVYQQTNNTWSQLKYQAIEMTLTKNMSNGFQFIAGINRQWHKIDGTWNPTDPARFVQPDHFANNANLYMPRGNNDENSLPDTGNALSYGPTWMKYRGNFGAVWQAPWGIMVAGNLTVQAGPWSGSPLYQLAANDPDVLRYGPSTVTLANGSTQPNPLATRNRYVFSDRGEGQLRAPTINTVGLKLGKVIKFNRYQVEVAGNVFNLLNAGDYTQYSYNSAYQSWSSNFLLMVNQQPARAFQLTVVGRF